MDLRHCRAERVVALTFANAWALGIAHVSPFQDQSGLNGYSSFRSASISISSGRRDGKDMQALFSQQRVDTCAV
jgi:hypothetical protein